MNKPEMVAVFSALEVLLEDKNYKGIERIVKDVLREVRTPDPSKRDKAD
ncbi:hypothetical protein FACS1894217_08570 [Clostridia bacterium]|nr:hypothetical protein FACS1894217_08570 [Clostridia bacterium]